MHPARKYPIYCICTCELRRPEQGLSKQLLPNILSAKDDIERSHVFSLKVVLFADCSRQIRRCCQIVVKLSKMHPCQMATNRHHESSTPLPSFRGLLVEMKTIQTHILSVQTWSAVDKEESLGCQITSPFNKKISCFCKAILIFFQKNPAYC